MFLPALSAIGYSCDWNSTVGQIISYNFLKVKCISIKIHSTPTACHLLEVYLVTLRAL